MKRTPRYEVSSVHGRFQPLHLDHMTYLMTALDVSDHVRVGITQCSSEHPLAVPGADIHRSLREANPLTFDERRLLIELALGAQAIARDRFSVEPFPIETPDTLRSVLPFEVPILTTRVDKWNDTKTDMLRGLGYTVHVLYERDPPEVTGTQIRNLMYRRDLHWRSLVAAGTQDYLESLNLPARIEALRADA